MKRNIAIVAGGDTSEIVVSLRSAQGIYSFIDKEKYNLYIVEMEGRRWEVQLPDGNKVPVDRNDFSFTNGTEKVVFDFAYITIHGTPGEDGRLQGYFDMLRIPYSCCGVLAAAITYDKFACNQYLKAFGVRIAASRTVGFRRRCNREDRSALFYQAQSGRFELWRYKSEDKRTNPACRCQSFRRSGRSDR